MALKSVRFMPKIKSFELTFAKGEIGTVRVAELTEKAAAVEVKFETGARGRPFAALRSMFVRGRQRRQRTRRLARTRSKGWTSRPVMDFRGAYGTEFWLGRHAPSRHNTSAPDTVLTAIRARLGQAGRRTFAASAAASICRTRPGSRLSRWPEFREERVLGRLVGVDRETGGGIDLSANFCIGSGGGQSLRRGGSGEFPVRRKRAASASKPSCWTLPTIWARSASSTMPSAEAAAIIALSSSSAVALSRSALPVVPKGLAAGGSSMAGPACPICSGGLPCWKFCQA